MTSIELAVQLKISSTGGAPTNNEGEVPGKELKLPTLQDIICGGTLLYELVNTLTSLFGG